MSLYLGTSPIANTGYDKANKDLSNLTSTGKNIANWSNNVTNCITEIPQDIKLELNNGTLTLKAGSKVYVPNGAGVFDTVTISSDIVAGTPYTNGPIFVYYYNNGIFQANSSAQCSGASNTITNGFWYDTTNNFIKRITNSEVTYSGISFPIAIINASSGSWASIDQVFNGFGYIGSTVFALPGVKGLIPNGRNADGTLKNRSFELMNVQTITLSTQTFTNRNFVLRNGDMGFSSVVYYDAVNNTNYDFSAYMIAATGSVSSGKITSFTPKTAFHAVDYNDFNNIPHIVETYVNGTSWYKIWSADSTGNKWCEQGGKTATRSGDGYLDVTFLKPFSNTNYNVQQSLVGYAGNSNESLSIVNLTTTGCRLYMWNQRASFWYACGYIS